MFTRRAFGQTIGMAAAAGTLPGLIGSAAAQAGGQKGAATASDQLCDLSAIELVARLRRKDVSAREVMAAHLARIERVNPKVNAIVTLVAERAMADAAKADERIARGGPSVCCTGCRSRTRIWSTPRASARRAVRCSTATFADQRRADRDAHARGRRDHLRQDEHAGVRRRIADVQQRLRRDPQSVRRDEDLRRQQRRRGRGAGVRHGADRRRQRHRRLAPQSGRVLQRRRLSPVARPRAGQRGQLVAAVGVGTDGQVRRGCRAFPERDRRARPAQSALDSPRTPPAFARRSGATSRACVWRGGGPRRHSVRAGDPPGRRREPPGLREPRLHRRGGGAGFRRRGRGVSDAPVRRPITRSTRRWSGSGPTG